MPPPQPQPHITHAAPPKLSQISARQNLNPKNRHAHSVYNGDTSYPAYDVEIQKINIRSGRVLLDNHPLSPPVDFEEEKEEGNTQIQQPPFPERLIHPSQRTPEETELLGELENLCINIPHF